MPATNLVELCRQFLTPDTIGAMSSNLHLDPHAVEAAADGAVPALLASLGAAVGRPGGDRQLADAMAQVPQVAMDDPARYVERAEEGAFGDNGSNPLSGLLSSRTQESLAHAIGQYAHIGDGESKKLLGVIGPAVLGVLGRQRLSSGLDAIGLADLLSSQRRKIAGAIPPGLAQEMNASGLGDALKDRPRTGPVGVAGHTAEPRTARVSTAKAAPARRPNAWMYWLLGLAVLAAIAFWAIGNSVNREVTPAAVESGALLVGGVNLGDEVSDTMSTLRTTLGGVTDEAAARAAVPDLREATTQLENVGALAQQLSPDERRQLAAVVSSSTPAIEREFERILAMPGAGDVMRPSIEGIRTRLESLASA